MFLFLEIVEILTNKYGYLKSNFGHISITRDLRRKFHFEETNTDSVFMYLNIQMNPATLAWSKRKRYEHKNIFLL